MKKYNISIVGASGYTGGELIRFLSRHPYVRLAHITASKYAGKKLNEVFPHIGDSIDLKLDKLDINKIPENIDVLFAALPHGASGNLIKELYDKGIKIIDLGADFRLNEGNYREWYGDHPCAELLENAVYGIPELNRERIEKTKLIANPGCYPTSSILPLAPLLKNDLIEEDSIIIDSKSGATGAGRAPSLDLHFCEVNEGFKAYKVGAHRHAPEIEQHLSDYIGKDIKIIFTPHLLPIDRGILSTIYVNLKEELTTDDLISLVHNFYKNSHFIRIYENGKYPNSLYVRGSNFCDIGLFSDPDRKRAVIISAIDNLVKGAAGQAIQNMNIMLDIPETTAIDNVPIYP